MAQMSQQILQTPRTGKSDLSNNMVSRIYSAASVIFFNSFILFIVINIGFSGFSDLNEWYRKRNRPPDSTNSFRSDNPALVKVYPGLSQPETAQLIRENHSVTQGYEPYVQFKERPFHGDCVNVDSCGFRLTSGREKWPLDKNRYNIFVFGGSTAFGYLVADKETIASYLKQSLQESVDITIEVYNFGRCSYFSSQESILLQQLIISGNKPNLAIFLDGLNDFAHYNGKPAFNKELKKFMDEGVKATWKKVVRELPVTKFLLKDRDLKTEKEKASPAEVIPKVISRYQNNKDIIETTCRRFGIKTLFVWQPIPVYKYDQDYNLFSKFDYDGFLPCVRLGYEAIAQHNKRAEFGDNFLWLADMQENLKEPLYVDAVHYSARMSKLIADRIAIALYEKNILSSRGLHAIPKMEHKELVEF
ncbi:MAG: SGNH/GDSL hydrolase family protein [Desulfomonilaceae bacterium]